MNKSESIKYLDKIINGSKSIIDSIDDGKSINTEKAIRASMTNSILLAECIKYILDEIVEDNYSFSNNTSKSNNELDNLMNMLGIKK